jgi:hypothetical protein
VLKSEGKGKEEGKGKKREGRGGDYQTLASPFGMGSELVKTPKIPYCGIFLWQHPAVQV